MKNILKWTGCKNSLWSEIKLIFEKVSPSRFVDVFAGSLAVSLHYNHSQTLCNDINPILIELYKQISSTEFVRWLNEYNQPKYNTKDKFEELRALYNKLKKGIIDGQVCALFVYLNKRCFNGLYRENLSGEYNVPFRQYKSEIFNQELLEEFRSSIQSYTFFNLDYEKMLEHCQPGDLVYLDPPYYECENNTFTSYFGKKFDRTEQKKLCECLKKLDQKGIHWVLSNANCEPIRTLYADFHQKEIEVKRKMRHSSVKKEKDGLNEILIWNF